MSQYFMATYHQDYHLEYAYSKLGRPARPTTLCFFLCVFLNTCSYIYLGMGLTLLCLSAVELEDDKNKLLMVAHHTYPT